MEFVFRFLSTIAACFVAIATTASASAYPVVRHVLAQHDPQGRLSHTTIKQLGTVRVKSSVYSIYYLNFTNPETLHGQQRIAIIKNRWQFAGAYQCTLGSDDGKLNLGRDRLTVTTGGLRFTIRFSEKGPTRSKYFCGEGSGWEDGI